MILIDPHGFVEQIKEGLGQLEVKDVIEVEAVEKGDGGRVHRPVSKRYLAFEDIIDMAIKLGNCLENAIIEMKYKEV